MHEMSIASSVLDAVASEVRRYPGARPLRLGLRIGELSGIDPESLRFCLEAVVKDTDLDGLELDIEFCQRRHRCLCGAEFPIRDYDFRCPDCGDLGTTCISGEELELAYVEVEQDEPSTA